MIPDFGQTNFDATVLNLGPFEQQFSEQRSFFNGRNRTFQQRKYVLFQKNWWFPSKFPQLAADEEFAENPEKVKLLTLLKFQEEPKRLRNWIFQCHYRKTEASIRNINTGEIRKEVAEPLANYTCLCFETKDFMKIASVSLINTSVMRSGDFRDANATGLFLDLTNKKNTFNVFGSTEEVGLSKIKTKFGFRRKCWF